MADLKGKLLSMLGAAFMVIGVQCPLFVNIGLSVAGGFLIAFSHDVTWKRAQKEMKG